MEYTLVYFGFVVYTLNKRKLKYARDDDMRLID